MNLLRETFDKADRIIVLASSYDKTITYLNAAAAAVTGLPVSELVGASVPETLEHLQREGATNAEVIAESPLLRCLNSESHGVEHSRAEDGSWWVASKVPCLDPTAPEVLAASYDVEQLETALAQHEVLTLRACIALEHGRTQRLLNAAVAAIHEADRRLMYVGSLLVDAGQRPINPVDAPGAPL